MKKTDLDLISEKHRKWLNNEVGSERANLSGAKLSGANLRFANLMDANLSDADLRFANLSGAKLMDADLRFAKLSGANLSGADLRFANLSGANLMDADLRFANLSGAKLSGAKLPSVSPETDLIAKILALVESQPSCLNMEIWHSCETTHCLAGWAVTLHNQGKLLESLIGSNAAAALIFYACCREVPDFFSDEKTAVDWLRNKAGNVIQNEQVK